MYDLILENLTKHGNHYITILTRRIYLISGIKIEGIDENSHKFVSSKTMIKFYKLSGVL